MKRSLLWVTVVLSLSPAILYASDDSSTPSGAYDHIAQVFKELIGKFGGLTDENKETADGVLSSIKNTLDDPNPAASVKLEGRTQKQWDDLNSSSPELEDKNRKLQEENQKRIDNM